MEHLLGLAMARAERAVQLEVVHVVEEGASDGKEYVLKKKKRFLLVLIKRGCFSRIPYLELGGILKPVEVGNEFYCLV